jgi:hypothetical protein
MSTRSRQLELHLWNIFDLWDSVASDLGLLDGELEATLRQDFINVIIDLQRQTAAHRYPLYKDERHCASALRDLSNELITTFEEIAPVDPSLLQDEIRRRRSRKRPAKEPKFNVGHRVLERISKLMRLNVGEDELQDLLKTQKITPGSARKIQKTWDWPAGDPSKNPLRELYQSLWRLRRAADTLLEIESVRDSHAPPKLARERAFIGLHKIWCESPSAQINGWVGFVKFVEAVNKGLPTEFGFGSSNAVSQALGRLKKNGALTTL